MIFLLTGELGRKKYSYSPFTCEELMGKEVMAVSITGKEIGWSPFPDFKNMGQFKPMLFISFLSKAHLWVAFEYGMFPSLQPQTVSGQGLEMLPAAGWTMPGHKWTHLVRVPHHWHLRAHWIPLSVFEICYNRLSLKPTASWKLLIFLKRPSSCCLYSGKKKRDKTQHFAWGNRMWFGVWSVTISEGRVLNSALLPCFLASAQPG